jgi:hypothetical protein
MATGILCQQISWLQLRPISGQSTVGIGGQPSSANFENLFCSCISDNNVDVPMVRVDEETNPLGWREAYKL